MKKKVARLVGLIERNILKATTLTRVLREYASEDSAQLTEIITAINHQSLIQVHDILMTYPVTELGWSLLPATRERVLEADLSLKERNDVHMLQFAEDRKVVERLRELTRSRIEEFEYQLLLKRQETRSEDDR